MLNFLQQKYLQCRLKLQTFEVSKSAGRIILEPMLLVTPTTLASSMFCTRRAVLAQRFRGAGTSRPMLIGTIVHELFQASLL